MTDLAEFLLARIAEDEQIAKDAPGPNWHVAVERKGEPGRWAGVAAYQLTLPPPDRLDSLSVGTMLARSVGNSPFLIDHVARWSPARVLAECAAKRRIVELHRGQKALWDDDENPLEVVECPECGVLFPCPTLRLLALPYADHPDYREEWRP